MSDQTAFDDLCHDACGDNADKRAAFIEGWRACAEEIERRMIQVRNPYDDSLMPAATWPVVESVKGQASK